MAAGDILQKVGSLLFYLPHQVSKDEGKRSIWKQMEDASDQLQTRKRFSHYYVFQKSISTTFEIW